MPDSLQQQKSTDEKIVRPISNDRDFVHTIWKILTSLRLTVICLALGILLVWVGTVAQADEGLYQAQARYFKHWYVWGATLWGHWVPVLLPGGYLLGTVLLANLIAAHIKRFKFTKKQVGINLTHFGVILLLVGQLATDMLSKETHLRLNEGETKNYSEDSQRHELVFLRAADNNRDEVVAIPGSFVANAKASGQPIAYEKLPFSVQVKTYVINSEVAGRDETFSAAAQLTGALGMVDAKYGNPDLLVAQLESDLAEAPGRTSIWRQALESVGEKHVTDVVESVKRVAAQPDRAARLTAEMKTRLRNQMAMGWSQSPRSEIRVAGKRFLRNEPVTAESLPAPANNGAGKSSIMLPEAEAKDMDSRNIPAAVIEIISGGQSLGTWLVSPYLNPQPFTVGNQNWRVALRTQRVYHPFNVKLLQATHEVYSGTVNASNPMGIPKNFKSRVRIENAATLENREVDIYMNNPLRYSGLTFYQYQMTKDDMSAETGSSVLQVVRNPSWLTPYLGCLIVGLGMIWQFMYHLVGFVAKRRTATPAAAAA